MKKLIIFLAIMIFLFTSCVLKHPIMPYGVWKSEDPNLILDVAPGDNLSSAKYMLESGEELELTIAFNSISPNFSIYQAPETYSGENAYFMGTYKVKKDKLTLKLSEPYQIKTGYKTIVFDLIESYEVSSESE